MKPWDLQEVGYVSSTYFTNEALTSTALTDANLTLCPTLLIVDWRCAMTSTVREVTTRSMASETSLSDSASRADVASSSIKMGGFFRTARAIATRYECNTNGTGLDVNSI